MNASVSHYPNRSVDEILVMPSHERELEHWLRWLTQQPPGGQVRKLGEAICYVGQLGSPDDLTAICGSGLTALPPEALSTGISHAAARGELNLVKLFIEKEKIFPESKVNVSSVLVAAASGGHPDVVMFLLGKNDSCANSACTEAFQRALENSMLYDHDKTRDFSETFKCLLPHANVDAAIASALTHHHVSWPPGLDKVVNDLSLESLEALCTRALGAPDSAWDRLKALREEKLLQETLPLPSSLLPTQTAKRL